jgi:hypothetical protein
MFQKNRRYHVRNVTCPMNSNERPVCYVTRAYISRRPKF